MPKYATKEHIQEVFSHCGKGDWDGFFSNVVPDVGTLISSDRRLPVLKLCMQ
jgi:hypothetical protein